MNILVLGNHRSGTSITTEILQGMIGIDFPFPVSVHAEPFELVDIHTRFLERHGLKFLDRLYFPDILPDEQLLEDYKEFFSRYDNAVIKEPVLAVMDQYVRFNLLFPVVIVERDTKEIVESFVHHKKFTKEKAEKIVQWNKGQFKLAKHIKPVQFSRDKESYKKSLKTYIDEHAIPIQWNDEVFERKWNVNNIQPWKYDKRNST